MTTKAARVPYVPGEPGPIGYMLAQNQETGEKFWLWPDPANVKTSDEQRTPLTPEQRDRVKTIVLVFREHQRGEGGFAGISREFELDDNPEKEICIWEDAVKTYRAELKRRPGASPRQRQLLYYAVLGCMTAGSNADLLVSQRPALKGLSKLARVGETYEKFRRASPSPPVE